MILNIYKPTNITSYDCIRIIKKIKKDNIPWLKNVISSNIFTKKIGHAGTLDPFAEGVLVICTDTDTKKIIEIQSQPKEYLATIKFGFTSSTYDPEGDIVEVKNYQPLPTKQQIAKIISENFIGEISQMPPIFSAKKINGQRAYQLARNNKTVKLSPKKVIISEIEIIKYKYPNLQLKITCGSGTYIRSIAHDLGQILKTGGYCTNLIRTRVGEWEQKNSHHLPSDPINSLRHLKSRQTQISNF